MPKIKSVVTNIGVGLLAFAAILGGSLPAHRSPSMPILDRE